MDNDILRTFLVLAGTRNFTRTAEILHIVQSTVSVRINALEKELGVALFERTNKQVRLTQQGQLYLSYAQRLVDLADEAVMHLKTSMFYEHYLTVGGLDIIWRCGLSQLMRDYLKEHPSTSLTSMTYLSDYINQLLIDGIVDVAFVATPPSSKLFEVIPAFSDDVILVAAPNLPISNRKSVDVQELQGMSLLSGSLGGIYKKWYNETVTTTYGLRINMDITSLMIPFLIDGLGPGLILRSMVKSELKSGALIEIPLSGDPPPPPWESFMVISKEKSQTPVIQSLVEMLQSRQR